MTLFFSLKVGGQVCTGDLGTPISSAGTDFGLGTNAFGNPLSGTITNYRFISGTPTDGDYTIVKSTANLNPGWHQNITNHTPNDPNGYMMVVNASNTPGIFFQTTVDGLCPGVTYEFASYVINILRNPGIRPNIKFTIENDGVVIQEFSTNDIPEGSATDWIKYGTIFKTPANVGIISLKMTNQNPGGGGNDLALDDITFRPCGPKITPIIVSTNSNIANICEGQSRNINLAASVSSVYINPVYQWQVNTGNGFNDLTIPGSQSKQLTIPYINAVAGTYIYQLLAAESGNINAPNCRIASSPLTVSVNANPVANASFSGSACEGSVLTLNATGGSSYSWTGPNGFTSSLQSPVLSDILPSQSGIYKVLVKNSSDCSVETQLNLQILPKVLARTNVVNGTIAICEKANFQLQAFGGSSYRWEPAVGLSNANIANPIASPLVTTNYIVTVSNGVCSATSSVLIEVTKSPKADAGTDKKVLVGQSVTLDGKALGDKVSYLWSPTDYLDDPTKMSPIATPLNDILYTLTVKSPCGISKDDVFVKFYPKVEIKNSFSPNGDGNNDTWNIPALEAFPSHELKIINRNGRIVFANKGSYLPWDGKFNHKDVPVGTYYYTIFLADDFKVLTGWVFLLR